MVAKGRLLKLLVFVALLSVGFHYLGVIEKEAVKEVLGVDVVESDVKKEEGEGDFKFVFNNNVALYSSYIVIQNGTSDNEEYAIETFIQLNFDFVRNTNHTDLRQYRCLLKFKDSDEVIEMLEPVDTVKFHWKSNKKLIFKFRPSGMHFQLDAIRVAVIRVDDFDRELKIDQVRVVNEIKVLSYSLIQFQKPSIVKVHNPIQENVAICAHYLYSTPKQLIPWIDMHLTFNVGDILIYDATENFTISSKLEKLYKNEKRVLVRKYDINRETLCQRQRQFPESVQEVLLNLCDDFYRRQFKEKFWARFHHEQLTVNDCFSVLKKKHKYVTYYDIDEFVFPRHYDLTRDFFLTNSSYSCNSYAEICDLKAFENQRNSKNYLYNYLESLVDRYSAGRSREKLNFISFHHSVHMIPDHFEEQLVSDLARIVKAIDANPPIEFPIKVPLGEKNNKTHLTFVINQEDVNYVKYFYTSYQNLIPCIYRDYLSKIPNLHKSLVRHLYFRTHPDQRFPKAIHTYNNVKAIFVHYASDVYADTWVMQPPDTDGHLLAHFRNDMHGFYDGNFTIPIRNLAIDFEYVSYLLKHYTAFCKI